MAFKEKKKNSKDEKPVKEKKLSSETKKKLKQIISSQSYSPILDVKKGIILTKDGSYVKLMEFSPINFGLRSSREKNQIIEQFGAALRSMPLSVQFKVVSQRADSSSFIEKIEENMKTEESKGCKILQEDQINFIDTVSAQGISRRFFLAFKYEEPEGFKHHTTFEKIRQQLNITGRSIAASLEACGNEQVSIDDSSDYTLSALYTIMCREQAQTISFDSKKQDVVNRYAELAKAKNMDKVFIPVNDFISPNKIEVGKAINYMIVDGLYYMFCYLPSDAYPTSAVGGWLQLFSTIGEGIDVDFWFHKEDIQSTQTKLQYVLRYNKVKLKTTEDTSQDYDDLTSTIRSAYMIRQGLSSGEDFCYMSTMLTITASSYEELKYRFDEIKKHCIRNGMKLKVCLFQQGEAFLSSIPLCKYNAGIWAKSKRNILTSDLASAYPFTSFELSDPNGILLGTNRNNGSLVFVDIFDTKKYNNANVAILGSSGAGKTYTLECMALRMRQKQTQVFIIAPLKGMEFERACRAVDGVFVKIAPGSAQNINIMEIRKKDNAEDLKLSGLITAEDSILMQKIQQIHSFFSLLVKDITFMESQYLDEALINTYAKYGITSDNKSLLDPNNPNKYRKMPVLGDLQEALMELGEKAARLYGTLTRYVSGSAKNFNQQTNVNLDNKYVVIDISNLSKEMLPVGMFIALDYVWDKARENRTQRKVIFIDEAWKLVGSGSSPQAAEFVTEIFKIIRGYGGSAIAATQDLNDFFAINGGEYGSAIINNARTKIIMKTEPKEAATVAKVMNLTEKEVQEISKIKKGTCLLAANTNHVFIDIAASQAEHDLITTDANDLRRIANSIQG